MLTIRALNRALLARQHLIERSAISAEEMVAHLVGLQAQAPNPPYFGLWTRLQQFHPDDLSRLIEQRRIVRIAMMRSTIHLVTAADCLAFRPLLQDALIKGFQSSYGRSLDGVDLAEVAALGHELVDERPRTFKELGDLLGARWPEHDRHALAYTVRTLVPLVQVPPRGLWGQRGQAVHASAERWLGRPLAAELDTTEMIQRYLTAFGPASIQDVQIWAGLTGLRAVVERLRPELRVFRDERGRELFDLPDSPRPDPETPVSPRYLPEFDNILLSHRDRTRIISEEHRAKVFTVNGIVKGTVLLDGFVAGTWKTVRKRETAVLEIELFSPAGVRDLEDMEAEWMRMLAFAVPGPRHEIHISSVPHH